jgi:hypothetical protein
LPADRRRRKFRWIEPVDATCVQRCNRGFRWPRANSCARHRGWWRMALI